MPRNLSDFLESEFSTVKDTDTLEKILPILTQDRFRTLFVINTAKEAVGTITFHDVYGFLYPGFIRIEGSLSNEDLLRSHWSKKSGATTPAFMKTPLVFCSVEDSPYATLSRMLVQNYSVLPVLHNGRLTAVVTRQKLAGGLLDWAAQDHAEIKGVSPDTAPAPARLETPGSAKRIYARKDAQLFVNFTVVKSPDSQKLPLGKEGVAVTENLSASGMLVRSTDTLSKDTVIELRFKLKDSQQPIQCLARVIRCQPSSDPAQMVLALEFLDITPKDRKQIDLFAQES